MYRPEVRHRALALIDSGYSLHSSSMSTGINRSTLQDWRDHPEKAQRARASCPRCTDVVRLPEPCADYAYLLGLYLGDGCISVAGDRAKGVWKLRLMCADAWPGLVEECAQAMRAIRPENKVMMIQCQGCTEVVSCSKHWPCLFPQHGTGRRHLRKIELADRQADHCGTPPGRVGARAYSLGWVWRAQPGPAYAGKRRALRVPAVSVRERVGWHPRALRSDAGPARGGVAVLEAEHDLGGEAGRGRPAGRVRRTEVLTPCIRRQRWIGRVRSPSSACSTVRSR
jgi:hypothetical protein